MLSGITNTRGDVEQVENVDNNIVDNESDSKEEIVIENYIPIVKYIASKVILGKTRYIEFEDLVGYGMVGLMDALSKFDGKKGMKFSTYASIRIKGAMIDEIRKNSPVSKGVMDKLNKYNSAVETLRNILMREPSSKDIAKHLSLTVEEIGTIENYINYISKTSLESVVFSDDDSMSLMNTIKDNTSPSPEGILESKELIKYLGKSINNLKEKDRKVIYFYYTKGMTLKEIGKILEVSESRVCQIHNRALKTLRDMMKRYEYESI